MKDGRYYVGMTSDLDRRKSEHGVKSGTRTTKIFGCEEVLYSETYPDRITAHKRENQIKRWTRAKKEALIKGDKEALQRLAKSRHF
jgi:predicted GIY-YIG superfamily endonuclease